MAIDIAQARAHQRRLESARRHQRRLRAERLRVRLPEASALLRDRYGVHDVRLFGSLASGDLTGHVDVDIAVGGLASQSYFAALADLMALFGSGVDLVRLEEAAPSLRERIATEGRSL